MAATMAVACSAARGSPSENGGGPVSSVSTMACMPASTNSCTMVDSSRLGPSALSSAWNFTQPPGWPAMRPKAWKAGGPASAAMLGSGTPTNFLDTSPPRSTSDATTGTPRRAQSSRSAWDAGARAANAGSTTDAGVAPRTWHALRVARVALTKDTLPTLPVAVSALAASPTPGTLSSHQRSSTWSRDSTPSSAHCSSTHGTAPSTGLDPSNRLGTYAGTTIPLPRPFSSLHCFTNSASTLDTGARGLAPAPNKSDAERLPPGITVVAPAVLYAMRESSQPTVEKGPLHSAVASSS
mmetsp:Transcript_40460/g.100062  ORF Transcript_40460/g.100062 Transcript_40460/m.100062 type:complete len:296 (+) Transcript_40460:340-1227(+)